MVGGLGADSPEAFTARLRAELQAFREFCQLLADEQAALMAGDTVSLLHNANSKAEKVALLTQMADARNQYLREVVKGADAAGIAAWKAAYDPSDRSGVTKVWTELLDLARSAKGLNDQNGILIAQKLASNQEALAVLRGAAHQATSLYGSDGQAYSTSTGRPLGKA